MVARARSVFVTSPAAAADAIISRVSDAKLRCVECEKSSDASARGWRGSLVDVDVDDDGEDEVVFYCPRCAAREFGGRRRVP
jgi:hypothetical protein